MRETGAWSFEPLLRVEQAELARQLGDHAVRERELRDAHRQFVDIGATGHADRVAEALAAAPR